MRKRPFDRILDTALAATIWPVWFWLLVSDYRAGRLALLLAAMIGLEAAGHPAPRPSLEESLPGEWYMSWGGTDYRASFNAEGSYHWTTEAAPFAPVKFDMTRGNWQVVGDDGPDVFCLRVREGQSWYIWELDRDGWGWSGEYWEMTEAGESGKLLGKVKLLPMWFHPAWQKAAAGRGD